MLSPTARISPSGINRELIVRSETVLSRLVGEAVRSIGRGIREIGSVGFDSGISKKMKSLIAGSRWE